jgi:outer membrane protein TolC
MVVGILIVVWVVVLRSMYQKKLLEDQQKAGHVLAPIYTGGYLQAQVKIADQNQKAALALYGQTVLQAFDDVEVTLTNERYLKDEQREATDALKST